MAFITPVVKIGLDTPSFAIHSEVDGRYVENLLVDSGTPQKLDIYAVAKSDRHKVTAGWSDLKAIEVHGFVEADTAENLIPKLDEIKKQLTGVGLTLFVSDGQNHRIWYVNTDGEIEVDHPKMTCNAKFRAKFLVANPPYGIEADANGAPLTNTQTFVLSSVQNVINLVFAGSARPSPRLQFVLDSSGTPDLTGLEFLNRETGQSLSISFAGFTLADNDTLVIDNARQEVLFRGRPIAYDGKIPEYNLGTNEAEVFFVTANTNIQVAAQKIVNDYEIVRDGVRVAQSFVAGSGQNVSFVSLALSKILSPTGSVRVGIMADSAGSPSGTFIGGTVNIDMATIKQRLRWFTVGLTGVAITAGSTYWLVADAPSSASDQVKHIRWAKSRQDVSSGAMKLWNGSSWVSGQGDMAFRAYTSNSTAENQQIDTRTYTNNFSATTDRDNVNNTALWDTANQVIKMNGVFSQPTDVFAGSGYDWPSDACRFCYTPFFKVVVPGIPGTTVKLTTVKVKLKKGGADNGNVNLLLRNTYNGTAIAYSNSQAVSATSYTEYIFTFNTNVIAGQAYWIGVSEPSWSVVVQGVQGTGGSTFDPANTKVALLTDWGRDQAGFLSPFYTGTTGIDHTATFEYTSYAAAENAVINQVNTKNADIISVSQYVITILTGGGTYQGQISANGGTNYGNIARDNAPFQTETIPAVVGNALKWKGILQNTVSLNNQFIDDLTLYWREGIALDATTKYASQSFQPTATGSVSTGKLMLGKLGTPGNLTVRIETNSGGSPSGTLAHANATATVNASSIPANGFSLVDLAFAGSFSLTGGTTYHIVVRPSATANDANKAVIHANYGRYANGEMKRSTNSGSSYSGFSDGTSGYDLIFGLYGSGGSNFTCNLDVTYQKQWL